MVEDSMFMSKSNRIYNVSG